jgi:hypothetical protein
MAKDTLGRMIWFGAPLAGNNKQCYHNCSDMMFLIHLRDCCFVRYPFPSTKKRTLELKELKKPKRNVAWSVGLFLSKDCKRNL